MVSTAKVGEAFWRGDKARGSSVHSEGDKLFSYATIILQRLRNGVVIGNATKYSITTSKHQSQCRVNDAGEILTGIPIGTQDLRQYYSNL